MAEYEKIARTNNSNSTDTIGLLSNFYEKSIIEDLIKCDLCNVIFDLNAHSPLVLKCGHSFCKRCISLKSNSLDKNINKSCPLDQIKNVMNLENAIPNIKLEDIVKKLTNLNSLLSNKKQIAFSKPVKKSISPIKSHNSNNNVNTYMNNINNNNNNNNNIVHKNNVDNNMNNVNKKKEGMTSNSIKNLNNINKKKQKNYVNNTKKKINSLNNINSIKTMANINNKNKLNII